MPDKIFESAPTASCSRGPAIPTREGCCARFPIRRAKRGRTLYQIPGLPPDVAHLPPGCPFAPRCDRAEDDLPRDVSAVRRADARHHSLCHFADDVYAHATEVMA